LGGGFDYVHAFELNFEYLTLYAALQFRRPYYQDSAVNGYLSQFPGDLYFSTGNCAMNTILAQNLIHYFATDLVV
jgi:hypothetical protein